MMEGRRCRWRPQGGPIPRHSFQEPAYMSLKPCLGGEQQQREEASEGTIKALKSIVGVANQFERYLDLEWGRRVRR